MLVGAESSKPSSDQKPGGPLLLFFPHLLISSPPHQHIPLALPSTHSQNLTISHHLHRRLLSGLLQHPPKRSLLLPLQSVLSTAIRVTLLKCRWDHMLLAQSTAVALLWPQSKSRCFYCDLQGSQDHLSPPANSDLVFTSILPHSVPATLASSVASLIQTHAASVPWNLLFWEKGKPGHRLVQKSHTYINWTPLPLWFICPDCSFKFFYLLALNST